MQRYNPKEIEPKWQQWWDEKGTYVADLDSEKPKYIGFGMFNYPSGAGIHVGHVKNFTLPDILLRAKRQQGFEAYSPVGFDSFGLPAENYAIKTGQSPRKTTDEAIEMYRKQYRAVGFGQDWSKEIDTSHADYYKWTQWCFLKLHENGLAYQKESMQWWCDQCKTVLADEQVIAGKCWRHDGADDPHVTKKSLNQWFFKITDYADEILEATDSLNWTPWVKTAQKNWIGRSEGAEVKFRLEGLGADGQHLEVFTTAVETIFGVTFMVLSPEHPVVSIYGQHADNAQAIDEYAQHSLRKSDLDREKEKVKTGVPIEGLFAVNPANGEKIPVWVADYVLIGYGSGAIMAVPGHDERDNAFAKKYELPIRFTTAENSFVNYGLEIKQDRSKYAMANSGEFDGVTLADARESIMVKLQNSGSGEHLVTYKIRDWLISRQRYWGSPNPPQTLC
jgi:leucyl-tRNA synthetase